MIRYDARNPGATSFFIPASCIAMALRPRPRWPNGKTAIRKCGRSLAPHAKNQGFVCP
jgi:hypothetical protein